MVSLQLKVLTHYHFCDERWYSQLGPTFKIVKEWQPDLFIVGLPLNMDDSESELSTRARKFARRLRHQTNIETWMVDERLTTREAREELGFYQEQGRAKKLSADSFAAALLIQSWYRNPVGLTP